MGLLRLLLAIGVLLQHVRGCGYALTGGATSVETFFIISGFLIAMILDVKYNKPGQLWLFLSNRALRIYSTYWVVLVVVTLIQVAAHFKAHQGTFDMWSASAARLGFAGSAYLAFSNLFIFGQDLALFLTLGAHGLHWTTAFWNNSPIVPAFMIIPPAWSLSLELTFYALAPWLLRRRTRWIVAFFAASLLIRIALWFAGLRDDPWSYRFFPNELCLFLAGALAYRLIYRHPLVQRRSSWVRFVIVGVFPAVILYPLYDQSEGLFFSPTRLLYLAYMVFAIPVLFSVTSRNALDRRLGELSYPLYLCHFSVVQVFNHYSARIGIWTRASLAIVLSCGLAYLCVVLLERPLDHFRQARLRRSLAGAAAAAQQTATSAPAPQLEPAFAGDPSREAESV